MVRIAVCDDEVNILDEIAQHIESALGKLKFPIHISRFSQIRSLWKQWEIDAFDVLFLDIDMPVMDGVAFGRFLRARNYDTCLIYVSNREDRVFETFAVNPLRFIRKSHFHDELDETAAAIINWWKSAKQRQLLITSRDSVVKLNIDDIAYVESFAKVQNIVTTNQTHPLKSTLSELEKKLLAFGFLRPHKGYLVNYRHIDRIERDSLLLRNGVKIPISKYKITEIKQSYLSLTTECLCVRAPSYPQKAVS